MQASETQSSLVTLKGKPFVAGQVWYDGHADASLGALIKETIGDVQKDADFVVKRPGVGLMSGGQFGLSGADSGARAWLPSLAATAASGPSSNWLAAIELDDGRWWVGAAHERAILHDGDGVFATRIDAMQRFRELREVPDATREVFCPDAWDIPEASEDGLDLINRGNPVGAILVPLSGPGALPGVAAAMRTRAALASFLERSGGEGKKGAAADRKKDEVNWPAVVVACSAVLAVGGWFGKSYIEAVFGPPKAKIQQRKPVQEVWPAPWLASPQIDRVVFHCQKMREELAANLMVEGWNWADGTCSAEGAKTDGRGNIGEEITFTVPGRQIEAGLWSDLSDTVRRFRGEDPVTLATTSDPKVAALIARRSLSARLQTPESSALWSHDEAIAYLDDLASVYGWAIAWGAETKPALHADAKLGRNAHESGVMIVSLTSRLGFLPEDFPQAAPGLVVSSYGMAGDLAAEDFKETIVIKAYYRG